MSPQREIRVGGALRAAVLPLLVLALAVAVAVALWGRGDLNRLICDGDCGPDAVIPPRELTIDGTPADANGPRVADPGPVDPGRLAATVAPGLGADVLGPRVGFAAISPDDGSVLAESGPGTYAPASTTKVLTSFAALATIDPRTRFTTRVVGDGDGIVLVGGGDPYLSIKPAKRGDDPVFRSDLTTLARRTATALKAAGSTRVRLGYDASLFTGPDASPGWESTYVPEGVVTPVSALWADEGFVDGVRSRQPARSAARVFAELLAARGIDVAGDPRPTTAPPAAATVAAVRGGTVAQIVETLVRVSDNQAAEVMLRHVAIEADEPASFAGGAKAVEAALSAAVVDTTGLRLDDGSGLSRGNRISPMTLAQTVRAASTSPSASALLADLPVAGFTGTLVRRYDDLADARGTVRAKTGTLTGIHALAGYVLDAGGRPVIFALMADRTDKGQPLAAQSALDRVATAIAGCRCG